MDGGWVRDPGLGVNRSREGGSSSARRGGSLHSPSRDHCNVLQSVERLGNTGKLPLGMRAEEGVRDRRDGQAEHEHQGELNRRRHLRDLRHRVRQRVLDLGFDGFDGFDGEGDRPIPAVRRG